MSQVITGSQIDTFRFKTLVSALRLEILGMKRRGTSAYVILKREYGLKGDKASVLKQATEMLSQNKT